MRPSDAPLLLRLGWLAETPEPFWKEVLARSTLSAFASGEAVYHAGDQTGGLIGLVEGRIELHLPGRGDGQSLGLIAGPGFWAGDLSALTGRPRRIGLVARTKAKVVRLPRSDMLRIAEAAPESWRYFALLAARNLAMALETVDALRREDPAERVGKTLLNLLAATPTSPDRIAVSQTDLGVLAALSRSTASAALSTLQARGFIRRAYRSVVIADLSGLTAFVMEG